MLARGFFGLTTTTNSAYATELPISIKAKLRYAISSDLFMACLEHKVDGNTEHIDVAARREARLYVCEQTIRTCSNIDVVVLRLQTDTAGDIPAQPRCN